MSISNVNGKLVIKVPSSLYDLAEDSFKFSIVLVGIWAYNMYLAKNNPGMLQNVLVSQALPLAAGLAFYHLIVSRFIAIMPDNQSFYWAKRRYG
jgi:hypothetical protein